MEQSNLPNPTASSTPSETVMILMQTICEAMQAEQSRATRSILSSILGIAVFIGLAIGGVIFCEFKYICGAFDFITVMTLCILLISVSYFAAMQFFCNFDIAREKYKDLVEAATKGVTITAAMERDFEEGRCIIVKITPKLELAIDSFTEEELGEYDND